MSTFILNLYLMLPPFHSVFHLLTFSSALRRRSFSVEDWPLLGYQDSKYHNSLWQKKAREVELQTPDFIQLIFIAVWNETFVGYCAVRTLLLEVGDLTAKFFSVWIWD